jgi:hypothetical protein
MDALPPPHLTYEQYKARRDWLKPHPALTFEEITKRVVAQQGVNAIPQMSKPTIPPERAARMLTLASLSIWPEIIPKLSADDALDVAEKVTDAELRDALSKHSLGVS